MEEVEWRKNVSESSAVMRNGRDCNAQYYKKLTTAQEEAAFVHRLAQVISNFLICRYAQLSTNFKRKTSS